MPNTTGKATVPGTIKAITNAAQVLTKYPGSTDISNGTPEIAKPIQGLRAPTLDGKPLKELSLLIKPAPCGPGYLITLDSTNEFSRVYYHNGRYILRENTDRLGYSRLESADLTKDGLLLVFNTGHHVAIPRSWYVFTWIPA